MKGKKKLLDALLEKVGDKLGELRRQKGYDTIKHFALAYKLPPVQYWRIEKGKTNLTFSTLARLMRIHSMSVEEFFCYLGKEKKIRFPKKRR